MSQPAATQPGTRAGDTTGNRRLHLQHGPIDLIIEAWGILDGIDTAFDAVRKRFSTILPELVEELPTLRSPWQPDTMLASPVAKRMEKAVAPFGRYTFVTPMAAVAGAVADETVETLAAAATLTKAYVNNGGDIAFHLRPGETLTVGLVDRPDPRLGDDLITGRATISGDNKVRGVATSGRYGRSLSLGLADAVSVAAETAATADVAATLIANAVNVDTEKAHRRPALELDPDSDLGARPVTVAVDALSPAEIDAALTAGLACASQYCRDGLITAASLRLQGASRAVGASALMLPPETP